LKPQRLLIAAARLLSGTKFDRGLSQVMHVDHHWPKGVSGCSSFGWLAGWPHLYWGKARIPDDAGPKIACFRAQNVH